jgi:hypothetical protein
VGRQLMGGEKYPGSLGCSARKLPWVRLVQSRSLPVYHSSGGSFWPQNQNFSNDATLSMPCLLGRGWCAHERARPSMVTARPSELYV